MKILIIHPIHPGQFGALATALVREGWDVIFLCRLGPPETQAYRVVQYSLARAPAGATHAHLQAAEHAVLIGQAAARAAWTLKKEGFDPDLIIGHAGFGELSFLPEVFPRCPILAYAEYFYRSFGADVGFDPALPSDNGEFPRIRLRNAITLTSLDLASAAYTPTQWQKDAFPAAYHKKISVIYDGVDTDQLQPDPLAEIVLPSGEVLTRDIPLITFAARALEHYRGFHKFWPALVQVLARNPTVEALVIGGDDPAYGPARPDGRTLRSQMLELHPADFARVRFAPALARASFTAMLQLSKCHVYFTYPFVPSWSLAEALSCATPVVASDVAPVREIVGMGTSCLVDFFDIDGLARAMEKLIQAPDRHRKMRADARKRAVSLFDFETQSWPHLQKLISEMVQ